MYRFSLHLVRIEEKEKECAVDRSKIQPFTAVRTEKAINTTTKQILVKALPFASRISTTPSASK